MENQTPEETATFAIKNPVCEVCGAPLYYSNKGTNWTCPRWDCKAFNVKRDLGVRGVSY